MVLLLVAFTLSGAAGLFYESVWSRYLSLFVGHSAYAQIITMVLFLGGMALGAMVVSRRSHRIRDPLLGYAVVELIVGLIGLAFHDGIYLPLTSWAYGSAFPALAGHGGLTVVKWVLAGALILPQSVLLGATFPLMTAGVLRRFPSQPGRILGSFYFANSFGAAVGVLVAGFVLYPWVGLPGTITAAAILNLLVALVAMVVGRAHPVSPPEKAMPAGDVAAVSLGGPSPVTLLLAVSAGTALASFIYEIAWIRMLSLVIGSATHSFEIMLSAFILGLAGGAFWVRRQADRLTNPLRTLAMVQLWMGGFALVSLVLYAQAFGWIATILGALATNEGGYALFSLAKYAIVLGIMLPATFCAGMTLPIITRVLFTGQVGERAIGTVYGVNTFGSIVGVGIAGLFLLPLLGLKGVLIVGGTLDMLLGVAILAYLTTHRDVAGGRRLLIGSVVTVGLALAVGIGVHLDQRLLASTVFRVGRTDLVQNSEILFSRDGRTATVHGYSNPGTRMTTISTNGKPDGSLSFQWKAGCVADSARAPLGGDDGTQVLAGLVAIAQRSSATSAAVIGHGTGMSSHFLLASPVLGQLTTIEIEPEMVEGSKIFYPNNRRVFDDPRSLHVFDDAKSYFAATNQRFDLIMSEPSNPWVSGVSGLFTHEFYARVRNYLAPGGVFAQWLQGYELSDELALSVLAALHDNFPDYRIYALSGSDVLVVASVDGPLPVADWSIFNWPSVRRDLCAFLPISPLEMGSTVLADRAGLAPLFEAGVEVNSDFYPILDLGAEKARFTKQLASGILGLNEGVVSLGLGRATPIAPGTDTTTALFELVGPRGLAQGTWLRRYAWERAEETAPHSAENEEALYRHHIFRNELIRGGAPTSWRFWLTSFSEIAADLHAGTRGWVDTAFFAQVDSYLAKLQAPAPVLAGVAFRKALARNDLQAAARPAAILLAEARDARNWLPADQLMDGGIMSFLAVGDLPSALAAWDLLGVQSGRQPRDARMMLLASHIVQARAAVQ